MSFVHLHTHTHYSLLDGAGEIGNLLQRAQELKMPALAITDHGNLYGVIEFYETALNFGVRPIIGLEAYMAYGSRFTRSGLQKESSSHLTLLAMNETGYRNLIKLSTSAFLEGKHYKPRIDRELLAQHHEGILCLSGCAAGEFARAILADSSLEMATEIAQWYQNLLGDRYYIELMDTKLAIQKPILAGCVEIADKLGILTVATNDVHYVYREDSTAQDILLCINTQSQMSDTNRMRMDTDEYFLKSRAEMEKSLPQNLDAIERTLEVAERAQLKLNLKQRFFPTFTIPKNIAAKNVAAKKNETLQDFLRELCLAGLRKRYANVPKRWTDKKINSELSEEVIARLDRELDVINTLGFADYFLIVWDFVRFAEERGIHRTARGSGVGAIVCYALNMSHVCPLEYDLLFERFLDENRKEAPDIDIDFDDQRRDEVFAYVREKYGEENVARIGTFGTLAAKGAVKSVGRVLDMPLARVTEITKLVDKSKTLKNALEENPELAQRYNAESEIKTLIDYAMKCEGLLSSSGTHACAVVIADKPLINYLPLALDKDGNRVTQWEMGPVEKAGLLKMDFLALRNLSILANTIEVIKETTGETLDPYSFPLDDAKTYALLNRGETKGIFQLESGGIRQLLQRMKPDNFRDIIATLALYRPGPLEGGLVDDYVNVKHGRQKPVYPHPIMEEVLGETHGVMVYQEQIMRILNRLGGIPLSDAYTCIKAIGKKNKDLIDSNHEAFIRGAQKNGVDGRLAAELFEMIQKFAGYGFNKSHSTAYALITYMTAYFKANYPVEFMAALLCGDIAKRNFASKDDTVEHIEDCKRMGIEVLPPDVNHSFARYRIEGEKKPHSKQSQKQIRFALTAIKACSESAADAIVAAREKGGEFKNLFDFCRRVDRNVCTRGVLEALIKSGALDAFGTPRSQMMQLIESALQSGQNEAEDRKRGQNNFLSDLDDDENNKTTSGVATKAQDVIPEAIRKLSEWSPKEKAAAEKEVLGMYWSSNPLAESDSHFAMYRTHIIVDALSLPNASKITLGGMISEIKLTNTKKTKPGQPSQYANFTLEDVSGKIRSIIWPQQYAEKADLIKSETLVVISGKLDHSRCADENDTGNVNLIVDVIVSLNQAAEIFSSGISLLIEEQNSGQEKLLPLARLLKESPGDCEVIPYVRLQDGTLAVFFPCSAKVAITPPFLQSLSSLLGENAVRVIPKRKL